MRYRRNMYQQPIVQENLKKLIPIYGQMGLFDWCFFKENIICICADYAIHMGEWVLK